MPITNGLLIYEAVRLYSDVLAENPIVPKDVSVITYDSIDGNGAYVGGKIYVGSDIPFDQLLPIFHIASGGKILKSITGSSMPADNVYTYTITSGDIALLGASMSVIGIMVNNEDFPASFSFSGNQGSLIAGDTIAFTGLPAKIDVTTLNFTLI